MTKRELRRKGYSVSVVISISELDAVISATESWLEDNAGPIPTAKQKEMSSALDILRSTRETVEDMRADLR